MRFAWPATESGGCTLNFVHRAKIYITQGSRFRRKGVFPEKNAMGGPLCHHSAAGACGPAACRLGATTRTLTLPAPTNVTASLTTDGKVKIGWDPGSTGVTAVIEVNPQGLSGFIPLGTATAESGQFIYDPGVPSNFGYRVKFVQGNAESPYTLAGLRVNTRGFEGLYKVINYLPLINK